MGSADPMTPVGVRPRRSRLLLLGTVLVVVAAIIATVILLTRDSGPATGTVEPSAEELQRLRTEAAAAAVNLFEKQVEADAAADPSVLDGVYVPGSQLGETQKRFVNELRTAGEISETRDEIADVNVVTVNRGEATVTLTYTVLEVTVRDSKTRKVKDVADEPTRTAFRVTLRRIDNRWLVDQLFDESTG